MTQATEVGTIYSQQQLDHIGEVGRQLNLIVHMDGARLANALATAQITDPKLRLKDLTWKKGVDVLTLGGTKNGLWGTDVVIFFRPDLGRDFRARIKQAGALESKARFAAAQWLQVLETGAWFRNAELANCQAKQLESHIMKIDSQAVRLMYPVEANSVFVRISPKISRALKRRGWVFYEFIGESARFMCSWATVDGAVEKLAQDIAELVNQFEERVQRSERSDGGDQRTKL